MSLFLTPNVVSPSNKTTSYTVSATDDLVPFLITAASNATLPATSGMYAGLQSANRTGGQGIVYIYNLASSTASVTIVAGSGDSLIGNSVVAPGQIVEASSDGQGVWYLAPYGTTAGGATVQTAVVPISSAQILALNATPVQLIASPGSGKAIRVMDLALKFTAATQYANGGALELRYTDASGTKVTADLASAIITSASGTSYTNVAGIEASLTLTTAAGIFVSNATAPYITGTGTGIFYITYRVVG